MYGDMEEDIKTAFDKVFDEHCVLLENHLFEEHDESTLAFVRELLSFFMHKMGNISCTEIFIQLATKIKLKYDRNDTIFLKMKHENNIAKAFKEMTLEQLISVIDTIPPEIPVDKDVLLEHLCQLFNIDNKYK